MLSVFERLERQGPFDTFIAVAESLQSPSSFNHEDIFLWGPSTLKTFLDGLLVEMSAEQRNLALQKLNPADFDFTSIVPVRKRAVVGTALAFRR